MAELDAQLKDFLDESALSIGDILAEKGIKTLDALCELEDITGLGIKPLQMTKLEIALKAMKVAKAEATLKEQAEQEHAAIVPHGVGLYKTVGDFGPQERCELLKVATDTKGGWTATKLVGDINVPRGKVSWKTKEDAAPDVPGGELFDVLLQFRVDSDDPEGFGWMEGATAQYFEKTDTWKLQAFGNALDFDRVDDEEAAVMIAARDGADW
eukprot:CAMPEP_0181300258 /NCGR_PEP_ID=MMETSP1101-20121128/6793_1 /TAXON_ID=46948 /ORGANISM="Rhodomonas abbreviata, Strain Caron Lab Isolate" /LENGTH=211 /DNA_ID=CAMNT_0023405481 /DNA_START=120 /DNA_END=752 /DNA_ORIENTATION=+